MRSLSHSRFNWLNLVWFNLIWFIAVYYNNQSVIFLALSLACHFYLTPTRRHDIWVMCSITCLGGSCDALLSFFGIMTFPDGVLLPLWLIMLWTHFALALTHGMAWINKLPIYVQALFGGLFGPFSYFIGFKMGVVDFLSPMQNTLIILVIAWFCLLPVYLRLTRFFRGNNNAFRFAN